MTRLFAAAAGGERALRDIFNKAGYMLGLGLSHLVNLYNPAKIIIAGKGVKAGPMLFDPMYENLTNGIPARFRTIRHPDRHPGLDGQGLGPRRRNPGAPGALQVSGDRLGPFMNMDAARRQK